MVIHNFNFVRGGFPPKTDPPLIVDPKAVLPGSAPPSMPPSSCPAARSFLAVVSPHAIATTLREEPWIKHKRLRLADDDFFEIWVRRIEQKVGFTGNDTG